MKLHQTIFSYRPMRKNLHAQARDFVDKHPMAIKGFGYVAGLLREHFAHAGHPPAPAHHHRAEDDFMAQFGFPGHRPDPHQAFHHRAGDDFMAHFGFPGHRPNPQQAFYHGHEQALRGYQAT